jgi:hypothetical protein
MSVQRGKFPFQGCSKCGTKRPILNGRRRAFTFMSLLHECCQRDSTVPPTLSGGLFINALLRETEAGVTDEQITRIRTLHASAYSELAGQVRPLPGARELLATLTAAGVPWAIATSGRWETAGPVIGTLGIPEGVPIVTRDQVLHAKPDPDLFMTAAERLGVNI